MPRLRLYLVLLALFLVTISLLAQDDECSALVQTALDSVADLCDETGRNQVCYGNIQLEATVVDTAPDFSFEAPGDLADVALIESLQLSVLRSPDEWGIALMKIQANLPDTVPGQNVTMLLFGDVEIENQADEMEGDEAFGPMQAFVFRSGVGELACDEAPRDGILIQTPTGAGTVTLDVNNVRIELGSTAFLNAQPDESMTITMLAGEAIVTAEGVRISLPAGLRAEIPLDADGLASGAPEIVPYEADDVANVPIGNLDEVIELPEPLPDPNGELIILSTTEWCYAGRDIDLPCDGENFISFDQVPGEIISSNPAFTDSWVYEEANLYAYFYPVEALDEDGNPYIWRSELVILSPDLIAYELFNHDGFSFGRQYYKPANEDEDEAIASPYVGDWMLAGGSNTCFNGGELAIEEQTVTITSTDAGLSLGGSSLTQEANNVFFLEQGDQLSRFIFMDGDNGMLMVMGTGGDCNGVMVQSTMSRVD